MEKKEVSEKVQDFVSKLIIDFSRIWKINLSSYPIYYKEICDEFESKVTKALYNK